MGIVASFEIISECTNDLNKDYIGDSYCDDAHNVEECMFDGGDCCQPEGTHYCAYCDECICHETSTKQCTPVPGKNKLFETRPFEAIKIFPFVKKLASGMKTTATLEMAIAVITSTIVTVTLMVGTVVWQK